ncbi:MAG: sigma-70 family RNA polymerase sigma factor [Myxococcales bacterium]|nr:sigma-70 family RNA polymerase sigma factor [Myxococcales bacterium]
MAHEASHRFLELLSTPELQALLEPHRETIERQWLRARSQWPDIEVDVGEFFSAWALRVEEAEDPVVALRSLRVGELYLSLACARGCSKAVEAFYSNYAPGIRLSLQRMRIGDAMVDDAMQTVLFRVLIGSPHSAAKITSFGGRGNLTSWLRVVAIREARQLLDREAREIPVSDAEGVLGADRDASALGNRNDPELALLRERFHEYLRDVFPEAVAKLSSRQRALLRLDTVDGLKHGQIASIYSVHRTTVLRWLQEAEHELTSHLRDLLRGKLSLEDEEFSSLLRVVRSDLSISVGRVLLEHQSS